MAFVSGSPSTTIGKAVFTPSANKDFMAIDDVTFTAVPEPTSGTLAALGLGLLAVARSRRRQTLQR